MPNKLKRLVCQAHLDLFQMGIFFGNHGNLSAIDKKCRKIAIKKTGASYNKFKANDIILVDIAKGVTNRNLHASSDTIIHLEMYRRCRNIGSIIHAHSPFATAWAQSGLDVPCLGTTHADQTIEDIHNISVKFEGETFSEYKQKLANRLAHEANTNIGKMVLICPHGAFVWGSSIEEAILNSVYLEKICQIAFFQLSINKRKEAESELFQAHFIWSKKRRHV